MFSMNSTSWVVRLSSIALLLAGVCAPEDRALVHEMGTPRWELRPSSPAIVADNPRGLRPVVGGVQFDSRISEKFGSDLPLSAQVISPAGEDGSFAIEIETQTGRGRLDRIDSTELWCAFNFVRPSSELLKEHPELEHPERYRGLVDATSLGEKAEFDLHPAVQDTAIGQSIARLDLLVSWMQAEVDAPSQLRKLLEKDGATPIPWESFRYDTLIWYDDELTIRVRDDKVVVAPISHPDSSVMRIRFWRSNPGDEVGYNSYYGFWEHLSYVKNTFQPLKDVDRFCRLVATLKWLGMQGCLPDLPATLRPVRVPMKYEVVKDQFMSF
jgi:hypothetical protein